MTNPASNLHRIMGSRFQHVKPNLCPTCRFRQAYGEWEGYCTARAKVLSAAKDSTKKARCSDYQEAEPPAPLIDPLAHEDEALAYVELPSDHDLTITVGATITYSNPEGGYTVTGTAKALEGKRVIIAWEDRFGTQERNVALACCVLVMAKSAAEVA